MNNAGFIYKWTNTVNGKWYIGSRKGTLDDGYRHSSKNPKMFIDEYVHGLDAFVREILFEGDYYIDNIREKEAQFLEQANAANDSSSYNQTNAVSPDFTMLGRKHTEETKQKMSEARIGKKMPPRDAEWSRKQREAHLGKTPWNKGRKHSKETRAKISESRQKQEEQRKYEKDCT